MRIIIAMSAIAAAALAAVTANAQTRVFQPSSAWALDYGDDYCRLMRDFSDGTGTVGLFIERTQPGPVMRLAVIGDAVRLYRGAREIGYRLQPSGAPRTAPRLVFETASGQQYLNLGPSTFADVSPPAPGAAPAFPPPYARAAEAALAKSITAVALDRGLTAPVVLETGPLGDAAAALQACADDLVASWGLDAEKHKTLMRPAMPARATAGWVSADTIPFTEFAKLSGGNNELRVMVDAAGKATDCHVQWPSLSAALNARICSSVLANGTFLPALDGSGTALASYWTANVFFLLPPFGGG